jgi:sRNA-binding regulator protein Hfq
MSIINTCDNENNKYFNMILEGNFTKDKVSIYLVNGIKMIGFITKYEVNKYIIIHNNINDVNGGQMILWSAIATITAFNENCLINNLNNNIKSNEKYLDNFLNEELKIFLCNGIKLQGKLINYLFEGFCIIEKNNNQQLVFWGAIVTISGNEVKSLNFTNKEENFNSKESILFNTVGKETTIFLKNGIKLKGILTLYINCFGNKNLDYIILDNNQLICVQHVSTITSENI